MMSDNEQIILDIQVKYADAVNKIAEFTKAKEALLAENKELAKQMKEDNTLVDANTKKIVANKLAISEQNKAIADATKELKNNVKQQQSLEGSVDSLRSQLSLLTKEYNAMSREQRESAEGKEFAASINAISEELKEANGAVGNFRDNVGDYRQSIIDALAGNNKYAASVMAVASNGMDLSQVMKGAMGSVKSFGLALKSLALNPVGAVLMVIATAIVAFKKGLESSEGSMQRFQTLLAPIGRLLDALLAHVQKGVDMFLSFAEGAAEAAMTLSRWMEKIPLVGDSFAEMNAAIDESITLQQRENQLQLDSRKLLEDTAKAEMEVSELRNKAKDREKYTAEERKKFLDEAIAKERVIADEKKKLAQEEYEILEARSKWADNDAETNQKLAEGRAKLYEEEKAYNDKVRELNEERRTLANEISAEDKVRHEEWKRIMAERAAIAKETVTKEIYLIRELVDSDIALMEEGAEKQRRIAQTNAERDIEALKERLATEKNLTVAARIAIAVLISNREKQLQQELSAIDEESHAQKVAQEREMIQLRLDAVAEGTQAEHELKMQALEADLQAELSAMEDNEEAKALIKEKYRLLQQESDTAFRQQQWQAEQDALNQEWENKLNTYGLRAEEFLQLQLEKAEQNKASLQQQEWESDEEYRARQIEADWELAHAKEAIANYEVSIQRAKTESIKAIAGTLSNALGEFAEESKEIAIAQKVLALAEIAVSTGEANAGIVKSASKELTMVQRIANFTQGMTMVLTNIATATKTIKGAKFAEGGLVTGEGTGTSDSIPAMLSNGESVLNYRATEMFAPIISAFNTMTGGVPIQPVTQAGSEAMGEEMLARAFARGASEIRPVVAVSDIRDVEMQVDVIDNISKLGGNG